MLTPKLLLVAVLRRLVRRQRLFTIERPVPADGAIEVSPPSGVTIRKARREEAAALTPLIKPGEPLERRLARGDILWLAEMDNRIIGWGCLASCPVRLARYRVKVELSPHERYTYGAYVLPEFRRRGVHAALRRARLLEAQRQGARMLLAHVDAYEHSALAAYTAVGFRPREESLSIVLLERFVITLWRRPLPRVE